MRRTTFLLLLAASTGCASSFRYDTDAAAPPAAQLTPTTTPSNDGVQFTGVGSSLRAVFFEYPSRFIDLFRRDTPSASAAALEDSKSADRRRTAINALADRRFGKTQPYTTRYAQMAQFDNDASVRATAIRALNRSRDGTATGVFISGLSDESPAVRLEAAKALSNVPDPSASPALLKLFQNTAEPLDNRIAAADALRQYRSLENARALVNVLNDRDFALSWQARQSLRTITGEDKRYDQPAWLDVLTGPNGLSG